jgi:hypothetical protein
MANTSIKRWPVFRAITRGSRNSVNWLIEGKFFQSSVTINNNDCTSELIIDVFKKTKIV